MNGNYNSVIKTEVSGIIGEENFLMDIIKELQNSDFMIRPLPEKTTEAMAYVPYQNAGRLYAPEQALASGTLFPELNKPFEPGRKSGGYDDDRA